MHEKYSTRRREKTWRNNNTDTAFIYKNFFRIFKPPVVIVGPFRTFQRLPPFVFKYLSLQREIRLQHRIRIINH